MPFFEKIYLRKWNRKKKKVAQCVSEGASRIHTTDGSHIEHIKLDIFLKINCTLVTWEFANVHPTYTSTHLAAVCEYLS